MNKKMTQNVDSNGKGKNKTGGQFEYNEKDIYVCKKIERDIKFFKNDYHKMKKSVFLLRK